MKRHILILLFFSINLFAQNEIIRRLQLDAAFDTLLTHLVNPSTVRLAEYDRVLTNQQGECHFLGDAAFVVFPTPEGFNVHAKQF